MEDHLILTLEAPLQAYGGVSVDALGPVEPFPAASLLAGLLGSALGWRRSADAERLQTLQDALRFAVRLDREPPTDAPWTDLQTVQLSPQDQGWTTWQQPQGREKSSPATLASPHLRFRDYHCDLKATVALSLQPQEDLPRGDSVRRRWRNPSLAQLAQALQRPARPLFLGRQSCPPMTPLYAGIQKAETPLQALLQVPLAPEDAVPGPGGISGRRGNSQNPGGAAVSRPSSHSIGNGNGNGETIPTQYVPGPGEETLALTAVQEVTLPDRREWQSGRHSGRRYYCRAHLPRSAFPLRTANAA